MRIVRVLWSTFVAGFTLLALATFAQAIRTAPLPTLSLSGGVRILTVLAIVALVLVLIASVPFLWTFDQMKAGAGADGHKSKLAP